MQIIIETSTAKPIELAALRAVLDTYADHASAAQKTDADERVIRLKHLVDSLCDKLGDRDDELKKLREKLPSTGAVDLRLTNADAALVTTGQQVNAEHAAYVADGLRDAADAPPFAKVITGHGAPELDADAAKLEALVGPGAAGLDLQAVFAPPPPTTPAPVDKTGLPWDGRIHASTKALNADGTWRQRRNLGEGVAAGIEAQLRAAMNVPAAPVSASPPPPPNDANATTGSGPANAAPPPPPPPPPAESTHYLNGQRVTEAEAAAAGGFAPPPPPVTTPVTFPELMTYITKVKTAKGIATDQINQCVATTGLPPSLPLLAQRPDLIPAVYAAIVRLSGVA